MLAEPWMFTALPGWAFSRRTSSSRPPRSTRVLFHSCSGSVVENTYFGYSLSALMIRGSSLPAAGASASPSS